MASIFTGIAVLYWITLFVLTHIPGYAVPLPPISDKSVHFVAYGVLALFLMIALRQRGTLRSQTAITLLAVLLAYGAIDEWTQIPVGRSCELNDWFADGAGAAVGVVLPALVLCRRSSLR